MLVNEHLTFLTVKFYYKAKQTPLVLVNGVLSIFLEDTSADLFSLQCDGQLNEVTVASYIFFVCF